MGGRRPTGAHPQEGCRGKPQQHRQPRGDRVSARPPSGGQHRDLGRSRRRAGERHWPRRRRLRGRRSERECALLRLDPKLGAEPLQPLRERREIQSLHHRHGAADRVGALVGVDAEHRRHRQRSVVDVEPLPGLCDRKLERLVGGCAQQPQRGSGVAIDLRDLDRLAGQRPERQLVGGQVADGHRIGGDSPSEPGQLRQRDRPGLDAGRRFPDARVELGHHRVDTAVARVVGTMADQQQDDSREQRGGGGGDARASVHAGPRTCRSRRRRRRPPADRERRCSRQR
jgi:hypothetical protein